MSYYYKRTEFSPYCLYTVGTGEGDNWEPESDHETTEAAAERVHYLNGGNKKTKAEEAAPELLGALKGWREAVSEKVMMKVDNPDSKKFLLDLMETTREVIKKATS